MTPTRELAIQIADSFKVYGKHTGIKNTVIFGGVKQGPQTLALRAGVDVLVATPGRLLDLINQGFISLKHIEYFVLDEADRMLDMGFIHDIKKLIARLPEQRQSLFFSATMPLDIVNLAGKILGKPEQVIIKPEQTTAERVGQSVFFVSKKNKIKLLKEILNEKKSSSTLIFSRTKHGADKIVKMLSKADITANAIHGNKSQGARQRALSSFKSGELKVLIATDIAARGIDVDGLELVINYDLPNIPETYVHRIGRTGRANASGVSLSFCEGEERPYLRDIQKFIDQDIPVVTDHDYVDDGFVEPKEKAKSHRSDFKPQSERTGNAKDRRQNRKYKGKRTSTSGGSSSRGSSASSNSGTRRRKTR